MHSNLKRYTIFALAALAFVILFSIGNSFLYVNEGSDASLFKQMGLGVLRGKVLYRDLFDNKGPLIFLLHALGLALGGNIALLIMQAVSLTVTFIIWDKILAMRCTERQRWIRMAILVLLLLCFYYDGDLSEEWCLPWASWPILVYLRSKQSATPTPVTPKHLFLIGLCFGVIAFIRPNNAVPFIGFIVYDLVIRLRKKEIKSFFIGLLLLMAGVMAVVLPTVAYFYLIAGWSGVDDMIYGGFLSNFEYMDQNTHIEWYLITAYLITAIVACLIQVFNSRKEPDVLIPCLISYFLFSATFGRRYTSHYLMVLMPLLVVLLTTFPSRQEKAQAKRNLRTVSLALAVLTTPVCLFYLARPLGTLVQDLFLTDPYEGIYAQFHECLEDIPEGERDSISIYNYPTLCSGMLQHEGLLRCNRRFIWKPQIINRLIREEQDKGGMMPLWVIGTFGFPYYTSDRQILETCYDLKYSFPVEIIYLEKPIRIERKREIWMYRRRECPAAR